MKEQSEISISHLKIRDGTPRCFLNGQESPTPEFFRQSSGKREKGLFLKRDRIKDIMRIQAAERISEFILLLYSGNEKGPVIFLFLSGNARFPVSLNQRIRITQKNRILRMLDQRMHEVIGARLIHEPKTEDIGGFHMQPYKIQITWVRLLSD